MDYVLAVSSLDSFDWWGLVFKMKGLVYTLVGVLVFLKLLKAWSKSRRNMRSVIIFACLFASVSAVSAAGFPTQEECESVYKGQCVECKQVECRWDSINVCPEPCPKKEECVCEELRLLRQLLQRYFFPK